MSVPDRYNRLRLRRRRVMKDCVKLKPRNGVILTHSNLYDSSYTVSLSMVAEVIFGTLRPDTIRIFCEYCIILLSVKCITFDRHFRRILPVCFQGVIVLKYKIFYVYYVNHRHIIIIIIIGTYNVFKANIFQNNWQQLILDV